MTNPKGLKLNAELDDRVVVGLRKRSNRIYEILTKNRKLGHFGMNLITPMLPL